jgi:hypothetical protein
MTTFFQDLHFALRVLRRDRWFTVTTVLILALGIGANTAVFSIVDSVLLRPLAYREPDRLFSVAEILPQLSHLAPVFAVNARHFIEWKRRCASFEDVALVDRAEFNLTSSGDPERLKAARVTANFFSALNHFADQRASFLTCSAGGFQRWNCFVLFRSIKHDSLADPTGQSSLRQRRVHSPVWGGS